MMASTKEARARELERHRERYYEDSEFRERVKQQGRLSAQKMHAELLANPKDPRHGTMTAYYKGLCKCRKCKDAMNEYDQDRRARLRSGRAFRRHRWSPAVQARLSERDQRIRAMARAGYGVTQAAVELGLHRDTTARLIRSMGLSQKFFQNIRATHCHKGHKFTKENTRTNPDGSRGCRACGRAYAREWRRAHAGVLVDNDHRHGSLNGYRNYSCRCVDCTETNTIACREYRLETRGAKDE